MRILFQGDSITNAFRDPMEINPAFQLGNGYVFLLAAQLDLEYPRIHEYFNRGVSGNGVEDLGLRWTEDALALNPDLVSILVGVNDTIRSMTSASSVSESAFKSSYQQILRRLREHNPVVQLVLVEPFLLNAGNVTEAWLENLKPKQEAVRDLASEFGAIFVPFQQTLNTAATEVSPAFWCYDGIHLTHAGFALLAQKWLKKTEHLLRPPNAGISTAL